MQQEFIVRGLAARDDARRTGKYVTAEAVLAGLDKTLARTRKRLPASELHGPVHACRRERPATLFDFLANGM